MASLLKFTYNNWRGETRERQVIPVLLWYGQTDYHPEQQWFLKAADIEKNEVRDFALKDIFFGVMRSTIDPKYVEELEATVKRLSERVQEMEAELSKRPVKPLIELKNSIFGRRPTQRLKPKDDPRVYVTNEQYQKLKELAADEDVMTHEYKVRSYEVFWRELERAGRVVNAPWNPYNMPTVKVILGDPPNPDEGDDL